MKIMIKKPEDLDKFQGSDIFKQFRKLPLFDKEIFLGLFNQVVFQEKQQSAQQNYKDDSLQKQPSRSIIKKSYVSRNTSLPPQQHQSLVALNQRPFKLEKEIFLTNQEKSFYEFIMNKLKDYFTVLSQPFQQYTLIQRDYQLDRSQKIQTNNLIINKQQSQTQLVDNSLFRTQIDKNQELKLQSNSGVDGSQSSEISDATAQKLTHEFEMKGQATKDVYQNPGCDQEHFDEIIDSQKKLVLRLKFNNIEIISGEPLNITPFKFLLDQNNQNQINENFCQFNNKFGQKEMNILKLDSMMVNSNIINAYVTHLMVEDEKKYFSLNNIERSKYNRLLIIGSEFITDCGLEKVTLMNKTIQQQKQLYLWLKYLQNFKAIQYQFWLIYKKIGFVVNISNMHWYFIQIIFEYKLIVVYDSMRNTYSRSYEDIRELFSFLFSKITRDENFQFNLNVSQTFEQQTDGLSCGYYTCIAANFLSDDSGFMKSLSEIKTILRDLLLQKSEQLILFE